MIKDKRVLPNHVAIIMDGNGRWAKSRVRPRIWGHVRGAGIVSDIVEEARNIGIKSLTLYSFSTENWSRPFPEVKTLFSLLRKFLIKEKKRILCNEICFKVIGDIKNLPNETKKLIYELENETSKNQGLKLTFAFGYGGRDEIVRAVNCFIEHNSGKNISEADLTSNLMNPATGDVDLLIRTGGDQRISNFLLWQMAYAELFFTDTKWPDFKKKEFRGIIETVSGRERRFGSITSTESLMISSAKAKENIKMIMDVGELS